MHEYLCIFIKKLDTIISNNNYDLNHNLNENTNNLNSKKEFWSSYIIDLIKI